MKKLLLTLLCAIMTLSVYADTWSFVVAKTSNKYSSHDFSKVVVDTKSDIILNADKEDGTKQTWGILINALSSSSKPEIKNDGNTPLGILIGSSSKPAKDITLYSGENFAGKTINKVSIKVCGGANACDFSASAKVGSYENTSETGISGTKETVISWEPNTTGEIEIKLSNNSNKTSGNAGIKICSITVEYSEAAADPTAVANPVITVEDRQVSIACVTEGATIKYSYTRNGVDVVTNADYAAPFAVEGYGDFVVKATASKEGLTASEATKSFTLEAPLTLADFLAKKPSDNTLVGGPLYVLYQDGQRMWLTDESKTNYIMSFNQKTDIHPSTNLTNGTILSSITGKYTDYKGLPELLPSALGTTSDGEAVAPVETALSDISADIVNHYVIVKKVKIASVNGLNVKVDGSDVVIYNQLTGVDNPEVGRDYDVTGFVGVFNETVQIIPVSFEMVVEQLDFTFDGFKDYTIEENETVSWTLPEDRPTVKFSSSDNSVAEAEDTGILAYKVGTATITASWDATPYWKAGSKEFTVTVIAKRQANSFEIDPADDINVNVGAEPVEITYISETEVTAVSSNEAVATVAVDAATEKAIITFVGAGEAVITFTAAETNEYEGATASLKVTVTDPNGPKEATFDFTNPTALGITPATNTASGVEVNGKVFTVDGVSITVTDGNNSTSTKIWTNTDGSYELRIYKSSSITITSPANTELTNITVTGFNNATSDWGTYTGGTWTPTSASSVVALADNTKNQVVLTANANASTQKIKNVKVEYKPTADIGTGIIEIEEEVNAPVEYYNLQGVRVAEPAAGQIVIERRGNSARLIKK